MKKRIISLMAGVLTLTLAFSLSTAALAVSPQNGKPSASVTEKQVQGERIADRQWRRQKQTNTVSYYGPEEAGHPQYDHPSSFRPTWLPEGWSLESIYESSGLVDQICRWNFRKETCQLEMTCYRRSAGYIGLALVDKNAPFTSRVAAPAVELQQVQVQGRSADFYQAGSTAYLFWENEGGDLFILEGDLDRTAMVLVADSVKEVKDQILPAYQLGWEPEGAKAIQRCSLPGAVMTCAVPEETLLIGISYYTWLYASEPLSAPAGTPETVKVRDMEALYWKGTLEADTFSNESLIATEEQMSVLIWTDPNTNLTFRIRGVLSKDVMLRMAESVALSQAEPTAAQPAAASKPVSAANTTGATGATGATNAADPNASRQSWVADGWKAVITHADGTVERVPNFSELFPGQELPAG